MRASASVEPSPIEKKSISTTWRVLRRALRLSFFLAATAILAAAWFLMLPFCARSNERRRALRGFVFSHWARACLTSLGVRLEVIGSAPAERCFLVANHLSYVDVLVLASRLNCVFVSMAEVLHWPFIGLMANSFGTVFIDRKNKREIPEVHREMESFLERGFIVVLFAEGKSSRGQRVEEFRPALLEPAAKSRHPVATATLRYETSPSDLPASISVCWSTPEFLPHALRLLLTNRIQAKLTFHADLIRRPDRKELAQELRNRVESCFEPMK
jgi:1-acyl-sn-glycerol-3-phosphate acyltransferase